eukprot:7217141-Pyramimonas_sp.AAC.1
MCRVRLAVSRERRRAHRHLVLDAKRDGEQLPGAVGWGKPRRCTDHRVEHVRVVPEAARHTIRGPPLAPLRYGRGARR